MFQDQLNQAGNLIKVKAEAEDVETMIFRDKDLAEQTEIHHRKSEIRDIEKSNKVKSEIENEVSTELNNAKLRFRKEKAVLHIAQELK